MIYFAISMLHQSSKGGQCNRRRPSTPLGGYNEQGQRRQQRPTMQPLVGKGFRPGDLSSLGPRVRRVPPLRNFSAVTEPRQFRASLKPAGPRRCVETAVIPLSNLLFDTYLCAHSLFTDTCDPTGVQKPNLGTRWQRFAVCLFLGFASDL